MMPRSWAYSMRLGNLPGDAKGVGDWQRPGERVAFDQLHHDGLMAAVVLEAVDRAMLG